MKRFCIIVKNISFFLLIGVSYLHLLNGDVLSSLWMNSLLVFGVSSVTMVILCFIGIIKKKFKAIRASKNDN